MAPSRRLHALLVVLLFAALLLPDLAPAQVDNDRRLYDNDNLFNQLSGAYRAKLERRFGRKELAASTKQEFAPIATGLDIVLNGPGSLSALANPIVNNAAADATSQDTQSETALILGSGSNVICGFNDSGSYIGGASHFTGWSQSANGGTTWTDGGALPTSTVGDAGDPVLARSASTGTIFLATLGFATSGNLQIFRSTNDGVTFLAPVNSTPGFSSPSHDKEWIAVDNFAGTGNGNVYQFWRNFATPGGMMFTRATNDGVTWIPNGGLLLSAANTGQGAFVAVGPDHAVYCFWLNGTSISMRKSTDQGVSFAAAVTVASLLSTGTNGDLGLAFRTNTFPHAVVNPVNGNIYVVYDDNPAGTDRGDIYLKQSTDGGATWSPQVRVNTDAGTNDQWQPTLAITPDGTALCVSWYDRRSDAANSLIERWGAIASISGSTLTWGPNFRISPQFPQLYGVDPVINSVYMGDYDQMAADNASFYTVWGDNRDQSIAVPSRKNANVRFAKIPKAGPSAILDLASYTISGGNGNGQVEANECNDIFITIKNNGGAAATGISATLAETGGNPEVDVTVPTQSYPAVPAGSSGTNTAAFKLNTTSAFACGATISLTLTLTYAGGSDVVTLAIPTTGPIGAPLQFDNNTSTPIPDLTTVNIPFGVSGFTGTVADVNLSLYLTHTWDADLTISLIGPDATTVILSSANGSSGDNYGSACSPQSSRTTFDDAASTLISAGAPPYVGSFKPQAALSAFNGKSGAAVNGTWTLRIVDGATSDVGNFSCASLFISPTGTCAQGSGECAPLPIQLASFGGRIVNGNQVQLDWVTLSEINNYGFEVEKSNAVPGPFAVIPGSFTPGYGTTNEPRNYSYVDTNPGSARVFYRLKQIDLDGSIQYSDPISVDVLSGVEEKNLPTEFSLSQNYPNPFNPSTLIQYGLPVATHVRLEVFNVLGQRVATLVNGREEAGIHFARFEDSMLPSGVYIYAIEAGNFRASRKFILLR
jgi:subtilisin-like proprotein convertase family protein